MQEAWPTIWCADETIGWVYQYSAIYKELRDQARKEIPAPRNSYELAFRNQFFTPRYVVEFLTDNTLGRIWYEMARARPSSKISVGTWFVAPTRSSLPEGQEPAQGDTEKEGTIFPQEEPLKSVGLGSASTVIPPGLQDSGPACGSGHFLAVLL